MSTPRYTIKGPNVFEGERILANLDWPESVEPFHELLRRANAFDELRDALDDCDSAFACWQAGIVPGRPEEILALTGKVRELLTKYPKAE